MRHRLYYTLPDIAAARALLDELLLARINEKHIRFLAKDGTLPPDMPEAGVLQKTDVIHGLQRGVVVGAFTGLVIGMLLALFPLEGSRLATLAILGTTVGGALFGCWVSGMVAAAIPNSRLKAYQADIERGRVLLIVDLPYRRVREVEEMIALRHPEIRFGGEEPHTPAFP